ncbi:uncharacterized protein PG998_009692 [Apiospora kogelbergensis]|uniref:Uncharacterized protein n=1 Tax=Apiospora kogelbergensis TaxID=1337665 RepID=A0AAW0R8C4_9PEZI
MAQQQPPSALAYGYQNEWPVYQRLKWGHELCPNPRQRPFAAFRNCREPVPPPHRKTAAELEHEARERAWVDRQIYLTNMRGRQPSVVSETGTESSLGSEQDSEQGSQVDQQPSDIDMANRESLPSAQRSWSLILSSARDLILDGMDFVAVLINWFYRLVIILTVILFLVSAFQDPLQLVFRGLLGLFRDDTEPEVIRHVLVQNYRSWSVAQPC